MNGVTLPAAGFAVPSEQTSLAAGSRRSGGDFRRAASSITNNALADVGPSLLSGSAISDVISRLGSATHCVTPLPYAIPMPADCGIVSAGAEAGVSLMQTMGGLPRSPGKVGASAASSHAADESSRRPSTAPSRDPGARHAAQAVASTMSPMLGELDSSWAVADSKEVEATLDDRLRKSMRLLGGSATRGESAPQGAFSPAEVSALRDILRRSAAAPSPAKSSSFSQSFARRSSAFEPRDAAEFAAAASNSGALGVDFGATSADDPDYDAGDAYRGSRGPSAPQTPVRASTPVAREQPQPQQQQQHAGSLRPNAPLFLATNVNDERKDSCTGSKVAGLSRPQEVEVEHQTDPAKSLRGTTRGGIHLCVKHDQEVDGHDRSCAWRLWGLSARPE